MWDQVGKALNASMVRVLSQFASLLPGILALIVALLFSAVVAWVVTAILRRSLVSIDFDGRLPRWGFSTVAEWSPAHSPTLLVTRSIAASFSSGRRISAAGASSRPHACSAPRRWRP